LAAAIALRAGSKLSAQDKLRDLCSALIGGAEDYCGGAHKLEAAYQDFAALRIEMSDMKSQNHCATQDAFFPEGLVTARESARGGSPSYFIASSEPWMGNKKLFATDSCLIGVGHASLRSGDLCCILFGGCVPFLLRPVGSAYRLVCECFIPGVMQGEAVVDYLLGDRVCDQVFDVV